MPIHLIHNLDDPLLEPFRDMRNRNWTQQSGIFLAEGPVLLERILNSEYSIHSLLLDEKYAQRFLPSIPEDTEVMLVEHALVRELVGFQFHRGVITCGHRKKYNELRASFATCHQDETLFAAFGVQDPENLGGILRTCAGLGIERILLGPGTADPLSRRALRVSMGTVLSLDLYRITDAADLSWLQEQCNLELIACSLRPEAVPLEIAGRTGPVALLVGNERNGLPDEVLRLVSRQVRIDMRLNTDSLNVSVAAGIVMHYFCRLVSAK
ncbi:MAG: RNA methyltransferase [Planctomycetales bacterium]|nr:RNA methyltransferase [Planctomycetales bacterium]